jgi:hypothetical protein
MNTLRSSRFAWMLFAAGISIVVAGFIVWTSMTGVSWWTSPNKASADRVLWRFLVAAFLVCVVAPLPCVAPLSRRLLCSVAAAVAVVTAYHACAFIHLLLYGV